MSLYGSTIPRKGRELFAKILATGTPLTITRVMMGQGICPDNIFPGDLEDLIQPVAAGTSNAPIYKTDTVKMTLQYRSDLNGGLDHGFWIREFGVFAKDPEGNSDVMIFYGALAEYGQWVSAYTTGGIDIREYDIAITVGEGATVLLDYSPEAFVTSEDVVELCTTVLLPQFLVEAQALIGTHNSDPDAHPFIRNLVSGMDARLSLLELMYNTDVSGNPFTVTFDSLEGLTVSGVHNTTQKRIEF